ncbi:ketopantoate reductase family protein [Rhodococcus jostii]|uniref:2-dehydropantoate 2-reductase n=1 Tax=Rhodococcus jostii TaxID=132919 RepID=A0A1H5HFD3_RHOJO|nr:2-dehydropantoate 2-reductase N-terminal domain-containing protein [Rhodococcus jostii]SEE26454.1 2-dehydropantoate 2-reductase [Rhodococcus jostii]
MTRYVVVGAGAVGATLAAQFHLNGIDYVLVARGDTYRALKSEGLRYVRPEGEIRVPVDVVDGPEAVTLRRGDVLVLAVKAQQADQALHDWAWRPVEGSDEAAARVVPVVTLQNGIESERTALRRFHHVYGASIWIPGTHVEPGRVIAAGTPAVALVWLGRYPSGADDRAESIAADLRRVDVTTQVVDDIQRWKATKLIGNLLNAVDIFEADDTEIEATTGALESEAFAVLAAAGITLADHATEATQDRSGLSIAPIDGHSVERKSTWQSLARGSDTVETDYLNGEISLLGRLHGVPTPVNDRLQEALGRASLDREAPGSRRLADVVGTARLEGSVP